MNFGDVSPDDLAAAAKVSTSFLWKFARDIEGYYLPSRTITVKGKHRTIDSLRKPAKVIMQRLHRFIQKELPAHGNVHGGRKGKSCFSAANRHLGKKYVVSRDIHRCYPSIHSTHMLQMLRKLGFRSDTAALLVGLFFCKDRIPQGAPLSSDALNFYLFDADVVLAKIARANGACYTRTYDDMVMSTDSREIVEECGRSMDAQIRRHLLTPSVKKTADRGIQTRLKKPRVHNILVHRASGTEIPPEQADHAKMLAEKYVSGARSVTPTSIVAVANLRWQVHGWLCHTGQARYGPARHLRKLLECGDKWVKLRLKEAGLGAHSKKWCVITRERNEPKRVSEIWARVNDEKIPAKLQCKT